MFMISLATIGNVLLLGVGMSALFLITTFIFYKGILIDFKQNSERMTAEELFDTLSTVISSEISIIEKDIFSQFGNVLDNQAFENYYQYLTRKCLNDLSKSFLYRASYIMNEDAIVEFVCKIISNYLKTKLASVPDKNTETDVEL